MPNYPPTPFSRHLASDNGCIRCRTRFHKPTGEADKWHPITLPSLLLCASLGLISTILLSILYRTARRLSRYPLPPGPTPLPIVGNMFQIPREREWVTYSQWAKIYGGIMHLSVLGRSVIILSSPDSISALLEKRNNFYSDRPVIPMAGEMIGHAQHIPLLPYGTRHREGRKLFLTTINQRRLSEVRQIQELKVRQFLTKLLSSPTSFRSHIRWLVAAVIIRITYGRNVESFDDPLIQLAEQVIEEFNASVQPGLFLVDSFPMLRAIPEWLPGAGFKSIAKARRERVERLRDEPYQTVKEQVEEGTALPSLTSALFEVKDMPSSEDEILFKDTSTSLYGAGIDTTASALDSFFFIMTMYPDIQRKAQAEVDAAVEAGSLPTFSDRPQLPYVDALIKEIYRWNPMVPLALPHRVTQDDVYEGYHIPAGATVIANSWAILHDPLIYPEPFKVIPERYSESDGKLNPDPKFYAFGYGRRACPGLILADDTLFSVVTTVLATFNITKATGSDDPLMGPNPTYTGTTISCPEAFDCVITPRSAQTKQLLESISRAEPT